MIGGPVLDDLGARQDQPLELVATVVLVISEQVGSADLANVADADPAASKRPPDGDVLEQLVLDPRVGCDQCHGRPAQEVAGTATRVPEARVLLEATWNTDVRATAEVEPSEDGLVDIGVVVTLEDVVGGRAPQCPAQRPPGLPAQRRIVVGDGQRERRGLGIEARRHRESRLADHEDGVDAGLVTQAPDPRVTARGLPVGVPPAGHAEHHDRAAADGGVPLSDRGVHNAKFRVVTGRGGFP